MSRQEDHLLMTQLRDGNSRTFEALFHRYYPFLCLYAARILKDDAAAEEIVQDLFVRLWENRETINIRDSVKNYLFRSVKNHSLNYLKHQAIIKAFARKQQEAAADSAEEEAEWQTGLLEALDACIASLPKKRQEIFRLSRQKGLKYHEIASELNISVKTVETQMGLAIKTLRKKLRNRI